MRSKNRKQHVGKNPYEKEAYRNFLSSKFKLDKTEDDPMDHSETDSSPFEEEGLEKINITPKSRWLKIKDFLNNNWVVSLISGLIILLVGGLFGGYISIKVSQAELETKVSNIENNIVDISKKYDSIDSELSGVDKNLNIMIAELKKDFEFLKSQVNSILR